MTLYHPIPEFTYVGDSAGKTTDHAAGRAVCEILACLLVGTRLQPTLLSNLHPRIIFFYNFFFFKSFKDSDDLPPRTQLNQRRHLEKGTRLPAAVHHRSGTPAQHLAQNPPRLIAGEGRGGCNDTRAERGVDSEPSGPSGNTTD